MLSYAKWRVKGSKDALWFWHTVLVSVTSGRGSSQGKTNSSFMIDRVTHLLKSSSGFPSNLEQKIAPPLPSRFCRICLSQDPTGFFCLQWVACFLCPSCTGLAMLHANQHPPCRKIWTRAASPQDSLTWLLPCCFLFKAYQRAFPWPFTQEPPPTPCNSLHSYCSEDGSPS